MKELLLGVFRGIGQVMFQRNALSGALMLAGIAVNSWWLAVLALAGSVVGTLSAMGLGYSRQDVSDGLYGFNATLVGIAVGIFFNPGVAAVVLFAVGAVGATLLARLMGRQRKLPVLTAPFVLTTWVMIAVGKWLLPSALAATGASAVVPEADWLGAFCLNIGQVMFLGSSIFGGILFLAGILVNSRINALYTVLGAALPLLYGLFSSDFAGFNAGLIGYNAVLCAIALGGRTWQSLAVAVVAVVLSVGLQLWGMGVGMITLTAPFVVAVWLMHLLKGRRSA